MSLYDFTNNGERTTIKSSVEAKEILTKMAAQFSWMAPAEYEQEMIEVLAYTVPTDDIAFLLDVTLTSAEQRRLSPVTA